MQRRTKLLLIILLILSGVLATRVFFFLNTLRVTQVQPVRPCPEFSVSAKENWLNSDPLHTRDLRGKVLLVFVWTFA